MAKKEKRWKILEIQYVSIFIALVVFAVIVILDYGIRFPLFTMIDLGMLNQNFQSKYATQRGPVSEQEGVEVRTESSEASRISPDIAIIGIDQTSLDKLGHWPFPRSVQARVLQSTARVRTNVNRERALLLDIFYNEPSTPAEDAALADAIRENGRVFLETEPNFAGFDSRSSDAALARKYALQQILFSKHGTVTKVRGPWRKARAYMDDTPPLAAFGALTAGYGHATLENDADSFFRRVALVARCSRLVSEKDIPAATEDLGTALKSFSVNAANFEWLAWKDTSGGYHLIDESTFDDAAAMERLKTEMRAHAQIRNSDGGDQGAFRIRLFSDYFVPSISLSLALAYYHKTMADVEIVYGEYVRIADPETYIINDEDSLHPLGGWQPLRRNGNIVKEIRIPVDEHGQMLINFMGPSSDVSHTFWVSPFWHFANPDVIPGPGTPPSRLPLSRGLANKIVIVCAYASGMAKDEKTTPFGLMYGGEVHANAVNTIIMGNFITRPPLPVALAVLLACVLFIAFASSRLPPLLSLLMTAMAASLYMLAYLFLFDLNSILLDFSQPVFAVFLTFMAVVAYRIVFEEQDKRRIKGMFSKYVSPQVVEQLLINPPELGGVDKEITVLFSDIRGFTTLSETLPPQELVNHLNVYLTKMTDVIFEYYGTLDKYVGDEIMCFWGAPLPQPDHALLACQCALKQIEVLNALNSTWPPEKRINIGIGINSGIMTVGNMGSPGRMNYTLMGDNCNLGARLEGTNKTYGTTVIISEYTYGLVKDRLIVRELDNIRVKGKNRPVLIYELIDVVGGLAPPAHAALY